MAGGNPPTAGIALTEYAKLGEGDWVPPYRPALPGTPAASAGRNRR